jgi:hypothetical protein
MNAAHLGKDSGFGGVNEQISKAKGGTDALGSLMVQYFGPAAAAAAGLGFIKSLLAGLAEEATKARDAIDGLREATISRTVGVEQALVGAGIGADQTATLLQTSRRLTGTGTQEQIDASIVGAVQRGERDPVRLAQIAQATAQNADQAGFTDLFGQTQAAGLSVDASRDLALRLGQLRGGVPLESKQAEALQAALGVQGDYERRQAVAAAIGIDDTAVGNAATETFVGTFSQRAEPTTAEGQAYQQRLRNLRAAQVIRQGVAGQLDTGVAEVQAAQRDAAVASGDANILERGLANAAGIVTAGYGTEGAKNALYGANGAAPTVVLDEATIRRLQPPRPVGGD